MEAILLAAAIVAALLIACIAYTTVVLFGSAKLIPGVEIDDFNTAIAAAISFTVWRLVLCIPAYVLIAISVAPATWQLGLILLLAIDLFALWRAERTAVHFEVTNVASRVFLTVTLSLLGAGSLNLIG